ncbi:MAG: hemerythrin domain-containing protein [Bacteroidales bacterium]|jgi:regulator of cell morphogenesis and NO signaling|nr:hemerythrin domain-containing protein [Bacteroidales bacterium]MDD2688212.1 hemerythrin domain-containing protein [Bacteroidales bacterium]MDD3331019.1 hemerythrin domain-containing protein [Bacteroidales bacterium]MDD3691733.1 hemerythrin domain-containing protein [Bacteroidales bacterium]MDD4044577.1 hemerythrin domain-containing protein [Bacteroidales bacterium]
MKPFLFTEHSKLSDLLSENHKLVLMIPRFGIEFGFGEKTVEEVCEIYHISPSFFILVCNVYTYDDFLPDKKALLATDMHSLIPFLLASHDYYLKERLTDIASILVKIADNCEAKFGDTLKRFFSDYKQKVVDHFDYEEKTVFPYIKDLQDGKKTNAYTIHQFQSIHSNIEDELNDLTNILIKYLPCNLMTKERVSVLSKLFDLSDDLNKHSLIEEKILIPYVEFLERNNV